MIGTVAGMMIVAETMIGTGMMIMAVIPGTITTGDRHPMDGTVRGSAYAPERG